jgi:hypothetical protein
MWVDVPTTWTKASLGELDQWRHPKWGHPLYVNSHQNK